MLFFGGDFDYLVELEMFCVQSWNFEGFDWDVCFDGNEAFYISALSLNFAKVILE